MKKIKVTTQSELVAVVKAGDIALVSAGEFYASGSAQVTASDSAQVTAYGSALVRAYDSAQVRAYGSAQVTAYGSAQVTASDSAQVAAYASALVRAYDSAQVRASKFVAVTTHGISVKVRGGRTIKIVNPKTVPQWCAFYGLTIKDGIVILYKGLSEDFKANHDAFDYTPGTTPEASDWDGGKNECGGGLHFSPRPCATYEFNNEAVKFVACPVRVKDIRKPKPSDEYPNKVKAKGCCAPIWECDIDGKKI